VIERAILERGSKFCINGDMVYESGIVRTYEFHVAVTFWHCDVLQCCYPYFFIES